MSEATGVPLTSSKHGAEIRRKLFVERWLSNGNNGAEAAIYAGFSEKGARVRASEMLADPVVQDMLASRKERLVRTAELSSERWAKEMAAIGHFDPRELYDEVGNLIPVHMLPEHVARAISSVKREQRTSGKGEDRETVITEEVKLNDKNAALANIGRHLGMFEKDNRQNITAIQFNVRLLG